MTKPTKTYHPTSSKLGRRIMAATARIFSGRTHAPDIAAWNAAVDAKKKLKLASKGQPK